MKLKPLTQLLQLLTELMSEATNMYTVKALEPQLNDDPQALFAIAREDDALVGQFYRHEHAEIACAALNQAQKTTEGNTTHE